MTLARSVQGGESHDNPYVPLYAIFMTVWAILFRAGWTQLELVYQRLWGVDEWKEEEPDRTAFLANPLT